MPVVTGGEVSADGGAENEDWKQEWPKMTFEWDEAEAADVVG